MTSQYQISRDNGATWWPIDEPAVRREADTTPGPEATMQFINHSGPEGWTVGNARYRVGEVDR